MPREVTQRADLRWRDEAGAESVHVPTDPRATHNPSRRSCDRDGPDVTRIGEHDLKGALQHVEDRLPAVDAGRFDCDVCAAGFSEPAVQLQQLDGRRAESPNLGPSAPSPLNAQAGDNRCLVHIDPTTPRMDDLHDCSQREPLGECHRRRIYLACSSRRGQTIRGADAALGSIFFQALGTGKRRPRPALARPAYFHRLREWLSPM